MFFLFKVSQLWRCSVRCVFCFHLRGKISDFTRLWHLFCKRTCDRHMSVVLVGAHFDLSFLFVLWLPRLNVGIVDCCIHFDLKNCTLLISLI